MSRIKYLIFILLVGVTACTSTLQLQSKDGKYIPVENIEEDKSIDDKIKPFRDSISKQMEVVIGKSEMEMKTGQPESLLGNFICDMLRFDIHRQTKIQADSTYFSILNTRGLRAPLPMGDIRVKNIFEIMPFENTIVLVEIKGEYLLEMVDFLAQVGGHPVSWDIKATLNKTGKSRILINGYEVQKNNLYHIITTDYLAQGGDNMEFLTKGKIINETGVKLRDFIINYISMLNSIKYPCNSKIDGRMVYE